jgi:hypothetical protein
VAEATQKMIVEFGRFADALLAKEPCWQRAGGARQQPWY